MRRCIYEKECVPGLTLVEVVMSMLVVGIMLVAVLYTVGSVYKNYTVTQEQQHAFLLAEALMDEILQTRYEDQDGTAIFGRELNESTTSRTDFDDVDDYHGWTASPPQQHDGTVLNDSDGWTRQVAVAWANVSNPNITETNETTLKRITVTVTSPRNVPYVLTGLRSSAGVLEYRMPTDQTYITGVEIQLQQENAVTQNTQYVSLNNHAQDE